MYVKHFVCLPTMFVCQTVVKWRLFSYNSIPILSWDLVGIQHKYSNFKSIFHKCPEKLVSQNSFWCRRIYIYIGSQNLKTCPRIYIYYVFPNLYQYVPESIFTIPESIFTICPRIYINMSQNLYLQSQNLHLLYVPEFLSTICPRIYINMSQNLY